MIAPNFLGRITALNSARVFVLIICNLVFLLIFTICNLQFYIDLYFLSSSQTMLAGTLYLILANVTFVTFIVYIQNYTNTFRNKKRTALLSACLYLYLFIL